jgi:hypothetical protein
MPTAKLIDVNLKRDESRVSIGEREKLIFYKFVYFFRQIFFIPFLSKLKKLHPLTLFSLLNLIIFKYPNPPSVNIKNRQPSKFSSKKSILIFPRTF